MDLCLDTTNKTYLENALSWKYVSEYYVEFVSRYERAIITDKWSERKATSVERFLRWKLLLRIPCNKLLHLYQKKKNASWKIIKSASVKLDISESVRMPGKMRAALEINFSHNVTKIGRRSRSKKLAHLLKKKWFIGTTDARVAGSFVFIQPFSNYWVQNFRLLLITRERFDLAT